MAIFIPNNIWNKDIRSISDISHPIAPQSAFRSSATTVSQLKIRDFPGEMFKGFEVL
jgi:hypothetical protein